MELVIAEDCNNCEYKLVEEYIINNSMWFILKIGENYLFSALIEQRTEFKLAGCIFISQEIIRSYEIPEVIHVIPVTKSYELIPNLYKLPLISLLWRDKNPINYEPSINVSHDSINYLFKSFPLNTFRLLISGDSGVGKSFLVDNLLKKHSIKSLKVSFLSNELQPLIIFKKFIQLAKLHSLVLIFDNLEQFFNAKFVSNVSVAILYLLRKHPSISIIGITNNENDLDKYACSLLFNSTVNIHMPTSIERLEIFRNCMRMTVEKIKNDSLLQNSNGIACVKVQLPDKIIDLSEFVEQENKFLNFFIEQCHGYIASDLNMLWNTIILSKFHTNSTDVHSSSLSRTISSNTENIFLSSITQSIIVLTERDFMNSLDTLRKQASNLRKALSTQSSDSKSAFYAPKLKGYISEEDEWKGIYGATKIKEELLSLLKISLRKVHFKETEIFSKESLEFISPPIGVILHGPPGTGKTLISKTIARILGVNFVPLSITDLVKSIVGQGEKIVKEAFELSKKCQPCILFLDELDAICSGSYQLENSDVLDSVRAQLILEIDNLKNFTGVAIIGTTNMLWKLDPALIRPGRLDRLIKVNPPSENERIELIKGMAKKSDIHLSSNNIIQLTKMTESFTPADLQNLINDAGLNAIQRFRNDSTIDFKFLEITAKDVFMALENIRPSIRIK